MRIRIIFPKQFFTPEQLKQLGQHDLKFIEGNKVDLDKINDLFEKEDLILAIDPTYCQDSWEALPVERIKRMKGLKALCLTTTSFSWVNLNAVKDLGIIVTNTPRKSTNAVAEFNIFAMYALLRKMPLIAKNNWNMDYDNWLNNEAKGLTAGIIGLGKIGNRVAELCAGNNMKVVYWNRSKKDVPYSSVSLETLFDKTDVVFNTVASPPDLKGFINKVLLSRLKSTAIIISTSDTHTLDKEFILDQVAKNRLGGFASESTEKHLQEFKGNVIFFPEQAYYTLGTMQNTCRILTETILSVIKGKPINKVS